MNKQQIIWLSIIIVAIILILVLHFGESSVDGNKGLIDFIKGFLTGLIIPLTIRFIMTFRKKS